MKFLNTYDVVADLDCGVLAPDGIRLSVDLYQPAGGGRRPAIVMQTAYDNNRLGGEDTGAGVLPSPADGYRKLAALGFVVAAIDARGRGDSEGVLVPFSTDGADGASVISWLRDNPRVNGRIGVMGTGYSGYAALATAGATTVDSVLAWSPPALSPESATPPLIGGVPSMLWYRWFHLKGGRSPIPFDLTNWAQVARDADRSTLAVAVGRTSSAWDSWSEVVPAVELDIGAVDAAVLVVSGWFDPGMPSTIGAWQRLRERNSTELIIGPWGPAAARRAQSAFGGIDWGPSAAVDPIELAQDWFSRTLHDGIATGERGPEATRGARLFRTGANVWTEVGPSWLDEHDDLVWTLWSRTGANTRRGDGMLADTAAEHGARAFDEFVYSPENPAPWQPSASGEPGLALNSSAVTLDPWFLTRRDDVLCYTSPRLSRVWRLSGEPWVGIRVGQDVRHGDWFALLEDVFPGGDTSIVLALGCASIEVSENEAQELSPQSLDMKLSPIHHELQPGHSLRLSVTSSLWPLFLPRSARADGRPFSRRRVYHDPEERSTLSLPVDSAMR